MPELLENVVVLGAVFVATVIAGLAILGRVGPAGASANETPSTPRAPNGRSWR
jgi:hypothetical protein